VQLTDRGNHLRYPVAPAGEQEWDIVDRAVRRATIRMTCSGVALLIAGRTGAGPFDQRGTKSHRNERSLLHQEPFCFSGLVLLIGCRNLETAAAWAASTSSAARASSPLEKYVLNARDCLGECAMKNVYIKPVGPTCQLYAKSDASDFRKLKSRSCSSCNLARACIESLFLATDGSASTMSRISAVKRKASSNAVSK